MKKKFRSLFIIIFSAFFLVLSSGVVITLHECCTKHHHAKKDHNHCHETKLYIKFEEDFIKNETKQLFVPVLETALFFALQLKYHFENTTLHFQYSIPPLLKFVGVNFVNFTSQRVYYC